MTAQTWGEMRIIAFRLDPTVVRKIPVTFRCLPRLGEGTLFVHPLPNTEEILMARLIVVAESEDTIAAPGDRDRNYIVVSVTDAQGVPVTSLAQPNFKVDPMIVGPGGALVDITGVTAGRLPGFYRVDVVPIRKETWKAGVYIFAIAVDTGAKRGDQGQTLARVRMD